MKKIPQDVIGNIAILKFPRGMMFIKRKFFALKFLRENKGVSTVLEKVNKFSGRLRKLSTRHLAGIRTKEAIYKENNCIFKFNVDDVYFSVRLSNERKILAGEVEKLSRGGKIKILVMFSGISIYPIVIAKRLRVKKRNFLVVSNELNRKANIIAEENIFLNKLSDYIVLERGDVEKLPQRLKDKFDVILMPRPNLKKTFLKTALELSKKGTKIFYYGFGKKDDVLEEIKRDTNGMVGRIRVRKAGDIAPRKFRWQASFKVRQNRRV